jgi:threonine aldolase
LDRIIDLRSDTVTQPTPEMRKAMYEAEVGDDFYKDDPTVNKLERMCADMFGKEAALFVASGTMGNLLSICAQTNPGDEVIVEAEAHCYRAEAAHMTRIAGVQPRRVQGHLGVLEPQDVEAAIRPQGILFPKTTLLCLESPHNAAGGAVIPPNNIAALRQVADKRDLRIHLDGARVFNAAVASHMNVADYVTDVHTVQFCLTKSLCCPFGSVVVGDKAFVERTRRLRQTIGGGMHQAGIMAAAGIVALQTMIERLDEDHANARFLAQRIVSLGLGKVDLDTVQTNMVRADMSLTCSTGTELRDRLALENVKIVASDSPFIRFVTHYWISRPDIQYVLGAIEGISHGRLH